MDIAALPHMIHALGMWGTSGCSACVRRSLALALLAGRGMPLRPALAMLQRLLAPAPSPPCSGCRGATARHVHGIKRRRVHGWASRHAHSKLALLETQPNCESHSCVSGQANSWHFRAPELQHRGFDRRDRTQHFVSNGNGERERLHLQTQVWAGCFLEDLPAVNLE